MSRPFAEKQGSQGSAKIVFQPPHTAQGQGPWEGGLLGVCACKEYFGAQRHLRGTAPLSTSPVPEGFWAVKSMQASGTRVSWYRFATGEFVTEWGGGAILSTVTMVCRTRLQSFRTQQQYSAPFFPPSSCSLLNISGSSQAPSLKQFRGLAGTGEPP